ncbi:MAG: zinc ABC transporter substrate-binding protein [Chloroflexi bacterium]|nr:zinc ABC transporter substrate-binding protein [Chloroflexota bacterium]
MSRRLVVMLVALLAVVAACGGTTGSPAASNSSYRVVATTSVFADLARLALGDTVQIDSIVPAGIDVHTFEPAPSDAAKIAAADLILMNGLGLDDWVSSLIEAAQQSDANVVRLGEGLDTVGTWTYLASPEGDPEHAYDPHVWLDPAGAELYVKRIAERVSQEQPELASAIAATSANGLAQIRALDVEVSAMFAAIPAENRKIVTFHDAFGYYARAYDITIVGVAIASPGQDPSAREIAALIDAIRASGVTTVFSEVQFPSKVLTSIAAETGATVLADLYSDALGKAPGDTYLGAMRANATAIAASMQR